MFRIEQNPTKRQRLYFYCYMSNLDQMIEYALAKQMDPEKYIASVRDVFGQKQR